MKNNKIALIHHIDNDGYMCGYLLKKYYADSVESGEAVLIPYNYEEFADWMTNEDYTKFVFADVTPPVFWFIENESKIVLGEIEVTIYDHHRSKRDEILKNFDNFNLISFCFAERRSGCKLLFDNLIFNDYIGLSIVVDFISDYDIWKFNEEDYPGIVTESRTYYKEHVLAFQAYMTQFNSLDLFSNKINQLLNHTVDTGYFFIHFLNKFIDDGFVLNNRTKNDNISFVNNGYYSTVYKCLFYQGYPNYFILKAFEEKYPDILYWCGFQINMKNQKIKFSMRSLLRDNCNVIAQNFGGNGHTKASGFTTNFDMGFKLLTCPELIFEMTRTSKLI